MTDQLRTDLDKLVKMTEDLYEDFENAGTPMERSTISRSLATLIKETRQGIIAITREENNKPPIEGPDELELLRQSKAG